MDTQNRPAVAAPLERPVRPVLGVALDTLMRLAGEVLAIAEAGETPDGDGVNVPTLLWAEEWARVLSGRA